MYPPKKLKQVTLDKPFLLTFRRRVKKGKYAGQYLFRIVASIRVVAQTGTLLKILAIEEWPRALHDPEPAGTWYIHFDGPDSWFFEQRLDEHGYAVLNPLYLQTIEEFPDRDLPLLLGWAVRYPTLDQWLTTRLTTPAA
jgi:hypothetical protein